MGTQLYSNIQYTCTFLHNLELYNILVDIGGKTSVVNVASSFFVVAYFAVAVVPATEADDDVYEAFLRAVFSR